VPIYREQHRAEHDTVVPVEPLAEGCDQPWGSMQRHPPVPSLFRQTPISTTKQHEPTHSEIPAQWHDRSYCGQNQKFEFYYDV
jgi:hypothetical protein